MGFWKSTGKLANRTKISASGVETFINIFASYDNLSNPRAPTTINMTVGKLQAAIGLHAESSIHTVSIVKKLSSKQALTASAYRSLLMPNLILRHNRMVARQSLSAQNLYFR